MHALVRDPEVPGISIVPRDVQRFPRPNRLIHLLVVMVVQLANVACSSSFPPRSSASGGCKGEVEKGENWCYSDICADNSYRYIC